MQNHVVLIHEASVSQLPAQTILGNHAHQELTDLLLTDLTQSETHLTAVQEATAVQSVHRIAQQDQTLIVLGNLVPLALTDHLLTDLTQTETHLTAAPEATTAQTVQHVPTQIVHGNHAHQEPIAQSAQVIPVASRLVPTLASLIATATRSVRTAYHAIAQEMKHLLALATRTQTRRLSSKTRF
jgi:hypothetical protein